MALWDLHCPLPPSSKAMRRRSCTTHYLQAARLCIAGVPLLRQRPPPGQDSPSPQLVGPRIAIVPLCTAARRCGSALQELHCPLPPSSDSVRIVAQVAVTA